MSLSEKYPVVVHDVAAKTLSIKVGTSLREVEKRVIEATLRQYGGNLSRSAKNIGD